MKLERPGVSQSPAWGEGTIGVDGDWCHPAERMEALRGVVPGVRRRGFGTWSGQIVCYPISDRLRVQFPRLTGRSLRDRGSSSEAAHCSCWSRGTISRHPFKGRTGAELPGHFPAATPAGRQKQLGKLSPPHGRGTASSLYSEVQAGFEPPR